MQMHSVAQMARESSRVLAQASTESKNAALAAMADLLEGRSKDILAANRKDMAAAEEKGLADNMVARLDFGESKIQSRINSLRKIEALADPVGQVFYQDRRPNGLEMARVRTPIGVILMVYEARPHVTVNAGAFCLKSGNASILRGGSEAIHCNTLMGELWSEAVSQAGLPEGAVQVITSSHEEIGQLLREDANIDLVIPRGGPRLIQSVVENSKIPVIKHFEGICHVYVDDSAPLKQAVSIVLDSKCLMPAVCNAGETALISDKIPEHTQAIVAALQKEGVTVRGCEKTRALAPDVEAATEEDWRTEYLDKIMSLKVVSSLDEAIDHINTYGSHHTDAIVTNDLERSRRFQREVDSGVVLVNASTMYCDGESLGMGAEIGISTDRLHARGPMGLEDLTTYKFQVVGEGHVMGPY